jgi:hypothetical protein
VVGSGSMRRDCEPTWCLGEGWGAAGWAVTGEFMGNNGDGRIFPQEKKGKKRSGTGAPIAGGRVSRRPALSGAVLQLDGHGAPAARGSPCRPTWALAGIQI